MRELIYAIVSNKYTCGKLNELLSGIKGITGANLYAVSFGQVSAVVSKLEKLDLIADRAHVIIFAEAIEKLTYHFTLLPMRFGSMLDSPHAIQKMLDKNYSELENNLRKVEDKSEFGLKIFCNIEKLKINLKMNSGETNDSLQKITSSDNDTVFRKYIKQKLEIHRIEEMLSKYIDSIIAEFTGFLIELNAEKKIKKMTSGTTIIDAVFLLKKEKKAKLIEAIEELQVKYSGLNFVLTGPWPPYSFVDITIK
jgi:hypothetical protein